MFQCTRMCVCVWHLYAFVWLHIHKVQLNLTPPQQQQQQQQDKTACQFYVRSSVRPSACRAERLI